jgi:hypothetical protein
MTYIDALYVQNGDEPAIAYVNMNERAMKNASEMSYKELLQGLVNACDKEIVSKYAKENI